MKRAFIAIAVLGLPVGLSAQREPNERPMDLHVSYTQFTLANGLNLLVHTDRTLPIVSVNLWYHVGSKNETAGRTGFAHLFEHLMFEGSRNVDEGLFDELLEGSGGTNNGATDTDHTVYWSTVPTAALERALWLEADRMGWLLDAMDQNKLDTQRSVVMNERRESYDNRPYGLTWETILEGVYPAGHPYRSPIIGSMEDLQRATLDDVRGFYRTFYHPGNASIAIAGDVSARRARELVELYFGDIPAGAAIPPVQVPAARIEADQRNTLEDDVQLPRLELVWIAPAAFAEGAAEAALTAELLAGGKSSRLYQRLVVVNGLAESIDAYHEDGELGGLFVVEATARPGVGLGEIDAHIRAEISILAQRGPSSDEVARAVAQAESSFVRGMERVGGFDGKADRLNHYFYAVRDPGYLRRDVQRHRAVTPASLQAWVTDVLVGTHSYGLSTVPRGRVELASPGAEAAPSDKP